MIFISIYGNIYFLKSFFLEANRDNINKLNKIKGIKVYLIG